MTNPKLSVIIPAYNAEKTLSKCLDSILQQDLPKNTAMEIIVINDGSTDTTGTILDEYAARFPEQIHVITVKNGGQGRARNFGLDHAQGEYIGFVDSDDWIDPDMYRILLETAETKSAELVFCDVTAHFPDGRSCPEPVYRKGQIMSAAGFANNKLFHRPLLKEIRYPEEGLWYEDTEFTAIAIHRAHRAEHVEQALYHYRRGLPSTMNNSNARKNLDILTVMQHLEEELLPQNRNDFEFLVLNHVLLDAMNRVQAMDAEEKRDVLWMMREWVREKIPHLTQSPSFRAETRNRRIIMWLNYTGMPGVAGKLLEIKRKHSI